MVSSEQREQGPTIWVDADACPNVIREILYRAAQRTGTLTMLVANSAQKLPASKYVRALQVEKGFDMADNEIVRRVSSGDLVITQDIPLAAEVIAKGAEVISPRGETFSKENIRQRLNIRDFMDTMRASGIQSGGPPPLGAREKQAFGGALDRFLARIKRPG
ncbi:YaiI/YqxD family protein [Aliiglaciecola sp. CAU 1673]|uniref:YaiI/YqxD family protein n=1 Tax=Aliiglaciecola sp. CAU 1673 TaxID=3032595 RepID=UPI0023DBAAB4|nr:YaiI/YqxD family protein [Aliiglaciecola sp. CAU 1673]MDF2177139.1 YaiI/YqxD family protein [Aliiglaciecola sp. CAU 1673]